MKIIKSFFAFAFVLGMLSSNLVSSLLNISPLKTGNKSPWSISSTPDRVLSMNSSPSGTDDIKWLQQALNITTGSSLLINGIFDIETKNALIKFQSSHNLSCDGVFGKQSLSCMVNELSHMGYTEESSPIDDFEVWMKNLVRN